MAAVVLDDKQTENSTASAAVESGVPEGANIPPSAEPSEAEAVESVAESSAATSSASSTFPPASARPNIEATQGIRFDFNLGARVLLPDGDWRVQLRDLDTGNILFDSKTKAAFVASSKRFYVRFGVEVWSGEESVFKHEYDARGQEVLIQFPVGTLGDTMGWMPYAIRFGEKHGCKLTLAISDKLMPLFEAAYPEVKFVSHAGVEPETYYATYSLGLFFDDTACIWQPTDFRMVGLHRTAGYILGVDPTEAPPRIAVERGRPMEARYIAIAVQSSSQAKYWNNPQGWREVVKFLKSCGWKVVCIDQNPMHGQKLMWNHIPHGVEDETGDRPLTERARWMRHADMFIGLSSGLSWLAWAAGTPVVMISGFTHPTNEFNTPGRVINWHACNSCWNDPALRFDHKDFMWCPRHAGTDRQFECTRLITPHQVIETIKRMPGFNPPNAV